MQLPSAPLRACGVLLLMLVLSTASPAAAAPCPNGAPPAGNPPALVSGPASGPLPAGMPDSGAGGAADQCGRDPNCSVGNDGSNGFSAPDTALTSPPTFAFSGLAPGKAHDDLRILALPEVLRQAAGCGQPALPSGGFPNPASTPNIGANPAPAATPPPCPPPPGPPPLPDPAAVARTITLPWPALQIRSAPSPIGLDGLPTWFWLEGIGGQQPISASRHIHLDGLPNSQPGCPAGAAADEAVGVQALATAYTWDFGDHLADSQLATDSPGVPYPEQQGAVRHRFETTSGGSGQPDGFSVTVIAHFRVQFRSGNGAWQPLAQTDRRLVLPYRVAEAYPVIVGP